MASRDCVAQPSCKVSLIALISCKHRLRMFPSGGNHIAKQHLRHRAQSHSSMRALLSHFASPRSSLHFGIGFMPRSRPAAVSLGKSLVRGIHGSQSAQQVTTHEKLCSSCSRLLRSCNSKKSKRMAATRWAAPSTTTCFTSSHEGPKRMPDPHTRTFVRFRDVRNARQSVGLLAGIADSTYVVLHE